MLPRSGLMSRPANHSGEARSKYRAPLDLIVFTRHHGRLLRRVLPLSLLLFCVRLRGRGDQLTVFFQYCDLPSGRRPAYTILRNTSYSPPPVTFRPIASCVTLGGPRAALCQHTGSRWSQSTYHSCCSISQHCLAHDIARATRSLLE